MKEIYFIRHGQTEYNKSGIVQGGGIDSSLNEVGRGQGISFFDRYKNQDFDVVLTSALKRTKETVAPFLEKGLPTEAFPNINEMGWGVHEGKSSNPTMHQEYRDMVRDWSQGIFDTKVKDGESAAELGFRIQQFLDHLKERKEQKILVCTHGRVMKCVCALLKGEGLQGMEPYKHDNTGLTIAHFKAGKFDLISINDLTHLA